MSAFPIDIIVKASALLAAAALVDLALARRASAAARHLVWSLAIAALLVLPIATYALPSWDLSIPVPRASVTPLLVTGTVLSNAVVTPDVAARAVPVRTLAQPSGTDAAARVTATGVIAALSVLYAIGVVMLLARLALEPFALTRLTRTSREVTSLLWRSLLEETARDAGVGRPVRLLMSAGDVMPMTFGTWRPAIVLPASADGWTMDRRRAVLLHELAHVARHDCLIQRCTAVACALYWPHPGVWFAARRLRVERELACDDRVLAAGAPARDYAGHLLEIAHTFRAAPAPATALGMARARQLEHRLLAILDAARNRASLRRRGSLVAVAVSLAVILPMAALRAAVVPMDQTNEPAESPIASSAQSPQDLTGAWDLRRTQDPNVVQVSIRTAHGNHGRSVRLDQLTGLPIDTIASAASAPVHFPIRRDAGTFTIDGVCRSGVCAGTYAFAPDPAFADMLAKRGIGRPALDDQLSLAIADVGPAYLDALAAAGYAKPDVALLVKAAKHGVDLGYVKDMAALGYKLGTLDQLVRTRDHGVDPEYIRGMSAGGVSKLTADELVRTRDHGVDPDYIRGLGSLGFTGLTVDALVDARDHGIDPEYIRGMQALGYKPMTLADLRRTRDHGVDPEYVRGLQGLGYTGLSIDALVGARNHGVDPEYVRDMAALGYKGVPLDQLIRMRDHGVDPQYVKRLQQRGMSNLPVEDIIRRRDRGDGN